MINLVCQNSFGNDYVSNQGHQLANPNSILFLVGVISLSIDSEHAAEQTSIMGSPQHSHSIAY